jgi:GH15 family glucan-1,4-alpha-glucosidase
VTFEAPPIADHALLSDCKGAALVTRDATIDWWCAPRFDSASIFGSLLDPDAGHWSLSPQGVWASSRRYVPDTMVLETTFRSEANRITVRDTAALERSTDPHDLGRSGPIALVREVACDEGEAEIETELVPRPEYGLVVPRVSAVPDGFLISGGPSALELHTDAPLQIDDGRLHGSVRLLAGERLLLVLRIRAAFGEPGDGGEVSIGATVDAWRNWIRAHGRYEGRYRDLVSRSAIVLQGLTYAPSGAVIAAPTTSLPEHPDDDWNWDYRYGWLRDLSLIVRAQSIAACSGESERSMAWIVTAAGLDTGRPTQIVFGVEGERDLTDRELDHLAGYRGARPVRVGNWAWRQKQLDPFGQVLESASLLGADEPIDEPLRDLLLSFADQAARRWHEDDAGMWEARDRERPYLTSKVLCWVALDRAISMAERLDAHKRVPRWSDARDEVREAVLAKGWNEEVGAFTGAFGSDELDASVLLMPLVGFLPATDERMSATIEVVADRLTDDEVFVRRWAAEPHPFVLCSFWLSECLALVGDLDRATDVFERTAGIANDLGLLPEMWDTTQGQMLGNFPQAFCHAGLIEAAWRLDRCGK